MESFRLKKDYYIKKTVRLPQECAEQLKIIAKRKNMSCNALIEQCIDFALQCIPENEK